MTMWTMLAIRELADTAPSDVYPCATPERNTVVLEPDDGSLAPTITAVAIAVDMWIPGESRPEPLLQVQEFKDSLFISDSRVALACTKYDKGGGWIGGVGALAINGVSKVRAAVRSGGKRHRVGVVR